MATTFNPADHPRAGSGRFTETARGESTLVDLSSVTGAQARIEEAKGARDQADWELQNACAQGIVRLVRSRLDVAGLRLHGHIRGFANWEVQQEPGGPWHTLHELDGDLLRDLNSVWRSMSDKRGDLEGFAVGAGSSPRSSLPIEMSGDLETVWAMEFDLDRMESGMWSLPSTADLAALGRS